MADTAESAQRQTGKRTGPRRVLAALALAQFVCSFAGSNTNVMINDISRDLDTTVQGVQVAITVFLLVMAALMIPGGRLTDRFGRKRCFLAGLTVYAAGALVSAAAPGLGVLILGYSVLEGIGTALLIPPVYILTTLLYREMTTRARAFGVIMMSGGIGAAAGPLIGGLITAGIGWRAAFVFQALVITMIIMLGSRLDDPLPPDPDRSFDTGGAVLSAAGLVLAVMGILAADDNLWLAAGLIVLGALVLWWFLHRARARERSGREPLLSPALFRNRTSNLGLVTQGVQWLLLMGTSFTVAAYLQVVRRYDAIETGVVFTAATFGLLASSLGAERLAKRRRQRTLILTGFAVAVTGVAVLIALAGRSTTAWASVPGLLLFGLGLGVMLTPSVNVVQSSFPEAQQGEISGLSRSVSNLGSACGTALAGTILVSGLTTHAYAAALTVLAATGLVGLAAAALLPRAPGDEYRHPRTEAGTVRKASNPPERPQPGKAQDRRGRRAESGTVAQLSEAAGTSAPDTGHPPSPQAPKPRRWLFLTLPGCWGALVLACLSFTPSLLPRGGLLQGLVCGITAAIGYGIGVLAAYVWRAFADRETRPPRRRSWPAFTLAAAVLFALSFGFGQYWQHEIRRLMDVSDHDVWLVVLSPLVAALIFGLILLTGRALRRLYHGTAGLLRRWIGQRAARAVGWIAIVGLVWMLVTGVLLSGFVGAVNEAFSLRDTTTEEGAHRPTTSLRSGGPGSLISWESLGLQGRNFTGTGPTADAIGKLTGHPAREPIRSYAGLATADDTESRAAAAVADLNRQGGFQRKNLLVVTTTGSGWVDPAAVDSFEYLSGGDSATVAIQYSHLPSWISYLVDQTKAREAGRALFDTVYDRWSKLPPDQRPRLFVAGESLGSFGGETAFSGEYDLRNRTAGTLFAGPPNFNTLFREFSDHRDTGSPEIRPVYRDGRTVRFTNDPRAAVPPAHRPWQGSRVLYLMHPSDPIVWWSPRLILHRPDWIAQPAGNDVLPGMIWIPFVTFWQVTADLPFATAVPGGHGHTCTSEYVDGWNAVLRPTGVTAHDLDRLRDVIAADR
ncbi:MFS transporter [Streptomyces sp. CRN 30]|uniref:MFS transporter n=1 Tax=Streptomyces sp. CRN 30 TaxID=3075613 RepID=UPI002A7F3370|nr:MFS transporter [Streptomyces sp. CRN 30]